jgi:hypothetical protein
VAEANIEAEEKKQQEKQARSKGKDIITKDKSGRKTKKEIKKDK